MPIMTALTTKVLVLLLGFVKVSLHSGTPGRGQGLTVREGGRKGSSWGIDCETVALFTWLTEEAADTVRAFTANGEMYSITQGSRVLLTCDAEPPLNSEVISYKWQYSCTGGTNGRCDIREEHPYYKIANDTLLVDITSPGQQIRYHCAVAYLNQQKQFRIETGSSPQISVMGEFCPSATSQECLTAYMNCVHFDPFPHNLQIALQHTCSPLPLSFSTIPSSLMLHQIK